MTLVEFVLRHWAIVGAGLVICWGVGRRITSGMNLGHPLEEIAYATALGMGTFGTVLFLLASFGGFTAVTMGITAGLAMAVAASPLRSAAARFRAILSVSWWTKRRLALSALGLVFASTAAWFALQAFYPPHLFDAVSYHLPVAKEFIRTGGAGPAPYLRFCVFPQLQEMLFAAMLLVSDDLAAQSLQFASLLITALALTGWGIRQRLGTTGLLAAAATAGLPSLLIHASAAYIDVGLMMFAVLAVLTFSNWMQERDWRWLALSGALLGFACASKYTAAVVAVTLTSILIVASVRSRMRALIPFVLALAVTAGPWYVRNVVYTGNPVFPFASSIFGNNGRCWSDRDIEAVRDELRSHGKDRDLLALVKLPWALTFHGDKFLSSVPWKTPLFLAAVPLVPVALWRGRGRAWLMFLVVATFGLAWFLSAQLLRYLYLVIPLVALLASEGLWRMLRGALRGRTAVADAVLAIVAFGLLIPPGGYLANARKGMGPIPTTPVARDQFVQRFPEYRCVKWLNDHAGTDYRVFVLAGEPLTYYFDGTRIGDVVGPGGYHLLGTESAEALHESLTRLGAEYFMITDIRQFRKVRRTESFDAFFELRCGCAQTLLWKVTRNGSRFARGTEKLRNPDFSKRNIDRLPAGWSTAAAAERLFAEGSDRGVVLESDYKIAQEMDVRPSSLLEILVEAAPLGTALGELLITFHWQNPSTGYSGLEHQIIRNLGESEDQIYDMAMIVPAESSQLLVTLSVRADNRTVVRRVSVRPMLRSTEERRAEFSVVTGQNVAITPEMPHRRLQIVPWDDGATFHILEPGAIFEIPAPGFDKSPTRVSFEFDIRTPIEGPFAVRFFADGGPSQPVWIRPDEHAGDGQWTRFRVLVPSGFTIGLSRIRIDPPEGAGSGWFEVRKIRLRPISGRTL